MPLNAGLDKAHASIINNPKCYSTKVNLGYTPVSLK
jgi:hypothetical protein